MTTVQQMEHDPGEIQGLPPRRRSTPKPKVACLHGHLFTPENTYIVPSTKQRVCRTCIRERTYGQQTPGTPKAEARAIRAKAKARRLANLAR